ncbi:MAG TPA: hypothetical protein DDW81_03600 [Cryomorphaceae bacterium]|nr:hypothetical protein [Owenweeksia sp.]HBF19155.1 hypothetical protein [Cryomorphaceae bacterium]HCQ15607.1 hypothetical protein [Cryomorphaceae bacterium]|tara:strand:+ start:1079 stop:1639 length:561 start_codon:yes stop_codon:yes gene_type:complete
MKISLNIRTGYTFRGRKNISDSREIAVIQPTDVDSGELKDTISYIAKDQVSPLEKHLLKSGDVLLSNKGLNFTTHLYKGKQAAVATSSFFILSPEPDKLRSEYLYWYLQQPATIKILQSMMSGSTVLSLSKSSLENLEVPLPPLAVQDKIIQMNYWVEEESKELKNLITKRREYRDAYNWELIKGI